MTECVFCGKPTPPGYRGKPRVICDDPECKREACRYGARILSARARRRQRENPQTERTCKQCGQTKPLTAEHFYIGDKTALTPGRYWDRWCIICRRRIASERRDRRLAEDETFIEAERARYRRRVAAMTPEQVKAERRRKAQISRNYRKRHPDRMKESQQRWTENMRADPDRQRAYLEARRIAYRLRQERDGKAVKPTAEIRRLHASKGGLSRLPAKPLADAVDRVVRRESGELGLDTPQAKTVCERLGIEERSLFGWRVGERQTVQFDVADAVLTRLNLNWWDVWGGEDYETALAVFDPDAAAA